MRIRLCRYWQPGSRKSGTRWGGGRHGRRARRSTPHNDATRSDHGRRCGYRGRGDGSGRRVACVGRNDAMEHHRQQWHQDRRHELPRDHHTRPDHLQDEDVDDDPSHRADADDAGRHARDRDDQPGVPTRRHEQTCHRSARHEHEHQRVVERCYRCRLLRYRRSGTSTSLYGVTGNGGYTGVRGDGKSYGGIFSGSPLGSIGVYGVRVRATGSTRRGAPTAASGRAPPTGSTGRVPPASTDQAAHRRQRYDDERQRECGPRERRAVRRTR